MIFYQDKRRCLFVKMTKCGLIYIVGIIVIKFTSHHITSPPHTRHNITGGKVEFL